MTEARKKGNYSYPQFKEQFETFDPKTQRGDARCECASACFFIWAAGAARLGDVVGVHRPSFDPAEFSKLLPGEARAKYDRLTEASKSYLTKVGVSEELINRIFAISSTSIGYLDQRELGRLRRSPHLEELLIAKCGRLTTMEDLRALTSEEIDTISTYWYGRHSMSKPGELSERVRRVLDTKNCEVLSLREIHRQTNREYVRPYDEGVADLPRPPDALSRVQAEVEAKTVLTRVLHASGIKGYWVVPSKDAKEHLEPIGPRPAWFGRAWWSAGDPDKGVLGWLGILGGMDVEEAAKWVAAERSEACSAERDSRFMRGPLRPVQGGARMMATCEFEGIRVGAHYTFISRSDGGLYVFATLPASENGLEAAGNADEKLFEVAARILGPKAN